MKAWRPPLLQVLLAVAYVVTGAAGLMLAFAHPSASPVWAPSGIALAAGLILGRRAWAPVFIGAFVVNVLTHGTVLTSLGIALGNTLEGVIGTALVNRWARGRKAFERARSAFRFVVLAGFFGTSVAATIGTGSLALGGLIPPGDGALVWFTWWLGDAVGILIATPAILLWFAPARTDDDLPHAVEVAGLAFAVVAIGLIVFVGASPFPDTRSPSEFLTMPLLMWAAYRFGPRGSIAAVLALSVVAVYGALHGDGPFIADSANTTLLLLQSYMGIAAATSLVIASSISQRRFAERQLREWSTTDPLTGLANHRQLTTVLEREIQRSQRTGRSFALLVMDLDHLKRINDRDGHLVGSRAIVRVADVLRGACRSVDTASRFGGDEYAVVLPESEEADARNLAERIVAQLARDQEWPPLTVSIGLAVAPVDGDSVEALIDAADRRMYGAKRSRVSAPVERDASP